MSLFKTIIEREVNRQVEARLGKPEMWWKFMHDAEKLLERFERMMRERETHAK